MSAQTDRNIETQPQQFFSELPRASHHPKTPWKATGIMLLEINVWFSKTDEILAQMLIIFSLNIIMYTVFFDFVLSDSESTHMKVW